MPTDNPFLEVRSYRPAVLGAVATAATVLILGLLLLFEIRPPHVVGSFGPVDLDLTSLAWIGAVMLTSDGGLPVVPQWIGLECQPGVSSRLIGVIAQSHSARFQLGILAVAVLSAATIAFVSIVSATPKREQTKTLKSNRPLWAILRRPERSAWLAGVASGSAFGILVLLFALLLTLTLD
ncbi:membrane hypothetical protein [Hyphomicrobiales bacterium]|nr:membrane hypothetical protein [Hyphomicrobiales bacterium]CAH1677232.1 membrane hypothetical protein [Hyphomicrobiales bacterium]